MGICATCYDIEINYCDDVIIELPLDDGIYEVQIKDHQTGMSYTQNIEFTDGYGTWNTTNTSGVFTPFSIYTLTVLDQANQPVSWTVGDSEYECATVTFKQITSTDVAD